MGGPDRHYFHQFVIPNEDSTFRRDQWKIWQLIFTSQIYSANGFQNALGIEKEKELDEIMYTLNRPGKQYLGMKERAGKLTGERVPDIAAAAIALIRTEKVRVHFRSTLYQHIEGQGFLVFETDFPPKVFTPKEQEVITAFMNSHMLRSRAQISQDLGRSESTVSKQLNSAFRALEAFLNLEDEIESVFEFMMLLIRHNIIIPIYSTKLIRD